MKNNNVSDETPASKLVRRRSRTAVYSTPPPPLPLISLPPDDEWEEFDTPTRTGFQYTLPHLELSSEEYEDTSLSSGSLSNGSRRRETPDHERPKICRLLSGYMTQNENFQTQRHGFGIDTRLVYKRDKENVAGFTGDSLDSSSEDLGFNALFESGNLDRAYRVNGRHYASSNELLGAATHATSSACSQPPFAFFVKADMEYDLYCDTDMNTHGHIQWYFFRATLLSTAWKQQSPGSGSGSGSATATATTSSLKVRFNIRNMLKKASLYNDGMLPTVYVDAPVASKRGWHHDGANVCYFKNAETYRNRKTGKVQNYYTLSFVYEFQLPSGSSEASTVVYFAHCYPYTYTRLQRFLLSLQKDSDRNRHMKRRILCKTIAGNNCDLLTITDFSQEDSQDKPYHAKRMGIFLTARVHPGESNSSFLMHGIIEFLTGNSLEARYLRHNFVFKVVPMLNPDGVVHGNYRCSLAGTDLNRRWMSPSPELHPTIFATKNAILSMKTTRPISLYCDIHGHSRKKSMFLYGCRPFEPSCRTEAARLRLFPHLLGKISNSQRGGFFSFSDCTFSVSGSKKGTGRVVVWKAAEVLHSFTLEASFYGVGTNRKQQADSLEPSTAGANLRHFTPFDLRMAGTKFCHAMLPLSQVINLDRVAAASAAPAPQDTESSPRRDPRSASCEELPSAAPSQNPLLLESASLPNLPPFAPAFSPRSSGNKLRLAPLQSTVASATSGRGGVDELASKASVCSPPQQSARLSIPPFLPQSAVDHQSSSALAVPVSSASTPFGFPSEFDQLFADDSMTALLSLSDPEDLLKEIEATLPDMFMESNDEDNSVGSESDPSGDNMEEEELQSANSWKSILPVPSDPRATEPVPKLPRTRPPRLMRHLSAPGLHHSLNPKNPPDPVVTPTRTEQKPELAPSTQVNAKTTAPLAPLRMPSKLGLQKNALSQNQPRDRNRDIASIHLRAVQRRSKSRREIQQSLCEPQ